MGDCCFLCFFDLIVLVFYLSLNLDSLQRLKIHAWPIVFGIDRSGQDHKLYFQIFFYGIISCRIVVMVGPSAIVIRQWAVACEARSQSEQAYDWDCFLLHLHGWVRQVQIVCMNLKKCEPN